MICLIISSETTSLPAVTSELQQTIEKRILNYRTAISNAKDLGESAKLRRYERGLKTLETMLAAVKRGKKINEEEVPPPVATGKSSSHVSQATGAEQENSEDSVGVPPESSAESCVSDQQKTSREAKQHLELESLQSHAASSPTLETDLHSSDTREILLKRQKEYKLAALKAKQQGDLEKAKEYMKIGKKYNVVLEALSNGQPIDIQNIPPSPQDLESLGNVQNTSKQKVPASVGSSQNLAALESQTQEASGRISGFLYEAIKIAGLKVILRSVFSSEVWQD